MAVMSYTIQQVSRYTPVADELETMLKIIQNDWGCKVISVCETTVNKTPDCSSQAFIIIYDDTKKDVQPVKRGRWFHINDEGIVYCSECNNEAYWDTDYGQQLFDFCPYCGARMDKS